MTTDLGIEWLGDRVLALTIDRPARRNVVDHDMLAAIAETLASEGSRAGAVILRGAGGAAFSAGFDLDLLTGTEADLGADASIGRAVDAMHACPAPVIAMIQGHCHGAGVELALSCDLRLAASDLKLSLRAVSLGVVYRYQLVSRLVQVAGVGHAADLLLAMPVLDAETALRWGMLTEVVEPDRIEARTLELAEMLAASPPTAVAGTKDALVRAARSLVAPEDLEAVRAWRRRALTGDERKTALEAARKRLGRS